MPQDHDIRDVIRALAAGTPVDWDVVDTAHTGETTQAILRELQLLSRIGEVHGTLSGAQPPEASVEAADSEPDDRRSERKTWGPFTLLERVGHGAYGDVYRAWDATLDREVALKLLRHTRRDEDTPVVEEGRMLARIRHPNVVTVHGADRTEGNVGIWMEFLEGQTLEEIVREHGPFSPREAASIGIAVCRGVAAVHAAGLVHGDIKAHNVMREDDGRIVLMDFGAGQRVREEASSRLIGTPLYLAPEILEGGPATVRSDVYSLGVLLFYLLSASYPVRATSLREVRAAHRDQASRSLLSIRPDVPRQLVAVIERALAADPANRLDSAAALETSLAQAIQAPVPRTAWFPSRRIAVVAPIVLGVASALVALAVIGAGRTAQTRLDFQPHDSVLITKFENLTGEPIFEGAVEYALQREFSNSSVIGLVPDERVEDALRLMQRPPDTVVDRTIGREVALRDGRVKALLAGRVERFGSNYVITAQLIDPADSSVVATIGEEAGGLQSVLPALRRQASRVRVALGEHRSRIVGADPNIEPGTTPSLRAFQLYNQSYRLGRQSKWPAALEVARQVVIADPEFASGWIWLAWAIRNGERLVLLERGDPRISRYRDAVGRALRLAERAPEWEQQWIAGSYHTLLGDHARSIPHYEALLRLRPDHFYALNNLHLARTVFIPDYREWVAVTRRIAEQRPNAPQSQHLAAVTRIVESGNLIAAKREIDQLDILAQSAEGRNLGAAFWRDVTLAYGLWFSGDVNGTLAQAKRIESSLATYPHVLRPRAITGLIEYYLSLGRTADATRFVATLGQPRERTLGDIVIAWESRDATTLRRLLRTDDGDTRPIPVSTPTYVMAGLQETARRRAAEPGGQPLGVGLNAIARGQLLLLGGQPEAAVRTLRNGVDAVAPFNPPDYYIACESLGDVLWQLGRRQEAITTLETCSRPTVSTIMPEAPRDIVKMPMDLRLADFYRQVARTSDAVEIERRLRARLALADPDFPLVQKLRDRK